MAVDDESSPGGFITDGGREEIWSSRALIGDVRGIYVNHDSVSRVGLALNLKLVNRYMCHPNIR